MLCLKIINNKEIRGFDLQAAEVKLLAYADDVAIFSKDQDSINKLLVLCVLSVKLLGVVLSGQNVWGSGINCGQRSQTTSLTCLGQ